MRVRSEPLLAELHAHSTWSDGAYDLPQLVDLYGAKGFDVLCVTDHVTRTDDPIVPAEAPGRGVTPERFPAYLAALEHEAARARTTYGMVVLPGLELSWNDADLDRGAHALAIGLRRHVSVDDGIDGALETAASAGAALVAAHPYRDEPAESPERRTRRFGRDANLRELVHRFELFNRTTLFAWVAEAGLPAVATGDFHRLEHFAGWKTLLPCARDPESIVAYLRSPLPVFLTRLGERPARLAA
jgi:predicted metal-dependent phosphoesterase TrpH